MSGRCLISQVYSSEWSASHGLKARECLSSIFARIHLFIYIYQYFSSSPLPPKEQPIKPPNLQDKHIEQPPPPPPQQQQQQQQTGRGVRHNTVVLHTTLTNDDNYTTLVCFSFLAYDHLLMYYLSVSCLRRGLTLKKDPPPPKKKRRKKKKVIMRNLSACLVSYIIALSV